MGGKKASIAGEDAVRAAPPAVKPVSLKQLFSFADRRDKLLMVAGTVGAGLTAAGMPYFMVFFGKTLDGLNDDADIKGIVTRLATFFIVLGCITMFSGFIQVAAWSIAGESMAARIKTAYIKAILRQDVGWFDVHPAGQLPSQVTQAMAKVQDGIGRKVSDIFMNLFGGIGCIIVGYYLDPVLAAILTASMPAVIISVVLITKLVGAAEVEGAGFYAKAGGVATEVYAGIRTVASLCSESYEVRRYTDHVLGAEKAGVISGFNKGLGGGLLFMSFFCSYALAFWYGGHQVADDLDSDCGDNCLSGGKIISTVFSVVFAAMQLGQTAPGLDALNSARYAAIDILATIDRTPPIDSLSDAGDKPTKVTGGLHIDNVVFHYPSRPDDPVYNGMNLEIKPGESVALVGPSGGGKSTFAKLLLRFYDPVVGAVRLDGIDIKTLNVKWYRRQIGYVSQEPVLFAGSIMSNIASGKPGATEEECYAAAKAANAYDFIIAFPAKFETDVGEGGLQLSGGQKQRIAISRAIINDPAILLLDEATSALDSESEKIVQEALEKLQALKKRTTITIAHRLSTIQGCDRIAYVANKGIAEIGSHSELIAMPGGLYSQLVAAQRRGADEDEDAEANPEAALLHRMSSARSRSMSGTPGVIHDGKVTDTNGVELAIPDGVMWRLWKMNLPDWYWIALGVFGSFIMGCSMPVEGIIIASLQAAYYLDNADDMRAEVNKWSLGFAILGAIALFASMFMGLGFSIAGERLTRKLREQSFNATIRHSIGWFDNPIHSTGALTCTLEEDCTTVAMATGVNLGRRVQLACTVFAGAAIGLVVAWQIGLVAMACIPIIGIAGVIQMAMLTGAYGDKEGLGGGVGASVIIGSALNGINTVQALNMQQSMCDKYELASADAAKGRKRRGIIQGMTFAYSQGSMYWVFAILFYYGAVLVSNGDVNFKDFFMAMFAVILGGFGVGQVNMDMGIEGKAKIAAARIFQLVDDPLPIDPLGTSGATPTIMEGNVNFKAISFVYPNRPDQPIYGGPKAPKGFNLSVKAGETMALVGPSGGGKSTCIALLMRFYDPNSGCVELDGRDVRELKVSWLRSRIGLVAQEPVLFQGSIMENIIRGKPDATKEECEAAAKAANAHNFISEFADGYNTQVGEKSALMSGGQKQRIAIARAIIKDPAILLLDEATSALDNESERVVQAALDGLQLLKKRTTLVVVHRLTTVRNADRIAVMSGGSVSELGSHDQLMSTEGSWYAEMYRRQTAGFT